MINLFLKNFVIALLVVIVIFFLHSFLFTFYYYLHPASYQCLYYAYISTSATIINIIIATVHADNVTIDTDGNIRHRA